MTYCNDSNYETSVGAIETDRRVVKTKITVRIPRSYHGDPILSQLVSKHGVTLNITAAMLGETATEGWFNLELAGTQQQVQSALVYLEELNLEVWTRRDTEEKSW